MAEPTRSTMFRSDLEGIGHLMRDRKLSVPLYQRSYSWGDEQVHEFFSDLRSAMLRDQREHFIGTIVLTRAHDGRSVVIDGQQRLATSAMAYAALRNELMAAGDYVRAEVIERSYLASPSLHTASLEPRVQLNADDQGYFAARVIRNEPIAVERASHKRIDRAMNTAEQAIRHDVAAARRPADRLIEWSDFIDRGVQTIVVDVHDDADAYLIFETLNDRGLDLTVADLLRNYLFSLAHKDLGEIQSAWSFAAQTIETRTEDKLFTTFIRHYWSSLNGPVREKDLYRSLRRSIKSEGAAIDFVQDLAAEAPAYAALLDPQNPYWERFGQDLIPAVESLARLRLEQPRPLLLAALARFSDAEAARLIRSLLNWAVRGIVVGGIGGGTAEAMYSEAAQRVRSGTIRSVEDVRAALATVIPSDEAFHTAFKELRETRSAYVRYYLIAIENALSGRSSPGEVPRSQDAGFRHRSILTAALKAADTSIRQDELRDWSRRLGNFYLVPTGTPTASPGVQNLKEVAANSHLLTNRDLLDDEPSSADSIRRRQTALANTALRVWPATA